MDIKKLGSILVEEKKIDKKQLQSAMNMYEKIGGNFATLLVKLGYVSDADVTATLGKLEGIGTVDVSSLIIPARLMASIPRDVIERHNIIPISKKDDQIMLAMPNINDYAVIEEVQFLTGCRVEPILASRESIRKAILQFYHEKEHATDVKQTKQILDPVFLSQIEDQDLALIITSILVEKGIITKEEILQKVEK